MHKIIRRIVFLFLYGGFLIPNGIATETDRLYISVIGGGDHHNSGWSGIELGVESDQWSPHDIFGGLLAMLPWSGGNSEFDAVYRASGFSGLFLGYRLRSQDRISPFVGLSGLQSLPTVEDSYFSLNPECGLSVRLDGPYELSLCGRYYFTTAGRDYDLWSVGLGLSRRCW